MEVTDNETSEAALVLAYLIRHQKYVKANIDILVSELICRGNLHDVSKLSPVEFPGFVNIHHIAREHPIGTPEYEAAMRSSECIKEHFLNNSHHPENHNTVAKMGWIDIIEMVIDWKAAADTYGMNSLRDSLGYLRNRHGFSDEQWWLVMQIVDWVDPSGKIECGE